MFTSLLLTCSLLQPGDLQPGDLVTMKRATWVPTEQAYYRDYIKYQRANDRDGVAKLQRQGYLLQVRPGDQVKVIDVRRDLEAVEVRIVRGSDRGFSGFLSPGDLGNRSTVDRLDRIKDELTLIIQENPDSAIARKAASALKLLTTSDGR